MPMRCRNYRFLMVLATGLLLLAAARPAHAGLAVSPLKQEITLRPGETGKLALNLVNRVHRDTDGPESATLAVMDVTVLLDGGLDFKEAGTQKQSASKWVTISQKQVTVEPGKALPIELTITPPPQAAPGEYYSAVIVSLASHGRNGKGVDVQYEVASGVFVTVLGQTLAKQAKITSTQIEWPAPAATQPATPAPTEPDAAKIAVILQNTGPSRFTATGRMRITDIAQGRVVMTAILTSHRPCVFGGDSRRFEAPISKPLPPGKYAVKVDLDYESTWAKAYTSQIIEITPEQSALLKQFKERQASTTLGVLLSMEKLSANMVAGGSRSLGLGIKSSTDVPVRCMLSVSSAGDTSIESWVTLGIEDFNLSPSDHKSVEVKLAVPADAKAGTYTATLALESWPEGSDVHRTEIPIEILVKAVRN